MVKDNILGKVKTIFQDVFDDRSLEVNNETNAKDIEDWDSLAQINLVVAIEKEFNIKFVLSELQLLNDVGDMIDLVEKKLSQNESI